MKSHSAATIFLAISYLFIQSEFCSGAKQPNILVILIDGQRADTINALGNPDIRTPSLDALARKSLVFTNTHCYGAHTSAVCIASRNQFMTGNFWHRWAPKRHCSAEGETILKVMEANGYETIYSKKVHVGITRRY
ncbi:sulfatase-like hydrolase/transferase [Calycomorphotria hydatis]|uniref:Arylsulfatase n=1 Tax=Calycomorphotria hydatis TaxID=2528027 RepID=A0A517TA64_9PLAN|nr:Arylsulfatase [Calycomorphotria hydatis]